MTTSTDETEKRLSALERKLDTKVSEIESKIDDKFNKILERLDLHTSGNSNFKGNYDKGRGYKGNGRQRNSGNRFAKQNEPKD